MKFVARDGTGQIVWLEQGNAAAGLQHILSRHAKDFETKLGISEANLTKYLHFEVSSQVANKSKYSISPVIFAESSKHSKE